MSNKWMSMMLKDEKNLQAALVGRKERVILDSPSLNYASSGGICKAFTTCFYGPEGSGKSLISMLAVAALHKSDPDAIAVLVSSEMRAPDPDKLRTLGVDPDRLLIRFANTIHDVFDWVTSRDVGFVNSDENETKQLIKKKIEEAAKGKGPKTDEEKEALEALKNKKWTRAPGMLYMLEQGAPIRALIVDSIKAIKGPKEVASESSEKEIMGDLSKFLNPALRDILPVIRKYNLMTIFVQQVNMNMNPDEVKYENKKYIIPSGQALRHFCESMALVERVTKADSKLMSEDLKGIREQPVQEGHTVRVKFEKANLDVPFREAEFRINYSKGIVDKGLEVANLAKGLGVIYHPVNDKGNEITAQWVAKIKGQEKKWIGFDNMVRDLEENPEMQRELMAQIYRL